MVRDNPSLLYLLYLSPYSPLFTFIQQTLPLFTQGNVRGRRHRILFRNRDSQRSRLCLALPACFCVRSRSHAQSVNRNLVFHLIFVVRSQTCSESFVYYNFELCDIRSAEPMHASRKSNHASVQHSGMFICSASPCVDLVTHTIPRFHLSLSVQSVNQITRLFSNVFNGLVH